MWSQVIESFVRNENFEDYCVFDRNPMELFATDDSDIAVSLSNKYYSLVMNVQKFCNVAA